MADSIGDTFKNVSGLISTLKDSLEIKSTVLLYNFVIFIDCAMGIIVGQGLLQVSKQSELPFSLVVAILLLFLLFSILMNTVMILITPVVSVMLTARVFFYPWNWLFHSDLAAKWQQGFVSANQLRRKAKESNEAFYIKLAEQATKAEEEDRIQAAYMRHHLITSWIITAFDLKYHFQSPSLLQQVADWINANCDWAGGDGYVLMWLVVVGLFLAILAYVLKDPSHYEYEPKLAS